MTGAWRAYNVHIHTPKPSQPKQLPTNPTHFPAHAAQNDSLHACASPMGCIPVQRMNRLTGAAPVPLARAATQLRMVQGKSQVQPRQEVKMQSDRSIQASQQAPAAKNEAKMQHQRGLAARKRACGVWRLLGCCHSRGHASTYSEPVRLTVQGRATERLQWHSTVAGAWGHGRHAAREVKERV